MAQKNGGIDAYADMWSYYVEKTPELKKVSDKRFDLTMEFNNVSEKYLKEILGKYGNQKLNNVSWSKKPSVAKYLSYKANDDFIDYLIIPEWFEK